MSDYIPAPYMYDRQCSFQGLGAEHNQIQAFHSKPDVKGRGQIVVSNLNPKLLCDRTQVPNAGIFRREDLKWYKNEAWIPSARLVDFLKGEESRPSFNSSFKIQGTETRNEKSSIVEVRYWCSYGPKDARKKVKPNIADERTNKETGEVAMKRSTETGASYQRGCRWHFTAIFKYKERPHDVLIRMHNPDHKDINGIVCHGMHDETARKHCAHIAPRISTELKENIERLLRTGVSPRGVMKLHREELRQQYRMEHPNDDGEVTWSRDMCLSLKDVHNVQKEVNQRYESWSADDATGLKLWVEANGATVLFYQEPDDKTNTPFIFVFATEWQLRKMAKLGHNNAVALDGTFGTNEYGYELHTLLCFDEWQNGIPTCWALTETKEEKDLKIVLEAVKDAVERTRSQVLKLEEIWMPSSFLVDCAAEEHNALKYFWPEVKIVLCVWHVRRAQYQNILKKVTDPIRRAMINLELGHIMGALKGNAVKLSEEFCAKWKAQEKDFVLYYEKEWHHKLERWVRNFRNFPHHNQDTNGGVERWHATLKLHLRTEKPFKKGRKIVWLVTQLVTELEHFFWCMSCMKWQGRVRNKRIETYVWSSILKARTIPDEDVKVFPDIDLAMVRSQTMPKTEWYTLDKWKTENCICTCDHSIQGNTCKHQVKLLTLHEMKEIDILHRFGTRFGSSCETENILQQAPKFEPASFDEAYEEVELPEVFNVTLPLFDSENTEISKKAVKKSIPVFTDEQFKGVLDDTLNECGDTATFRSIAMTKMLNWRHDVKNLVARASRTKSAHFTSNAKLFKTVDDSTTQKRHKSFVDTIYRGRKRQLAKRSSTEEKAAAVIAAKEMMGMPFKKRIVVKESTQQWLDRAAEEHKQGKTRKRQTKKTLLVMQDGTVQPRTNKKASNNKATNATVKDFVPSLTILKDSVPSSTIFKDSVPSSKAADSGKPKLDISNSPISYQDPRPMSSEPLKSQDITNVATSSQHSWPDISSLAFGSTIHNRVFELLWTNPDFFQVQQEAKSEDNNEISFPTRLQE